MRLYGSEKTAIYVQFPIRTLIDTFAKKKEYRLTLKTGASYVVYPDCKIFSISILGLHLEISKRA